MAEAPSLTLPGWRLFGRRDDLPYRHHVVAECTITNEYEEEIRVRLAVNWPRTKWYAWADYVDRPQRVGDAISTTSAKRAAKWEAAVKAGRVRITES